MVFFFSSRRRHTRCSRDWSSDVCSSDLIAYARALAPYGLRWYEEPGDPLDYELQAKLADHYPGPMATGENLFSLQDARNLRSEEHTSELQSRLHLVCRLLLEKKKKKLIYRSYIILQSM